MKLITGNAHPKLAGDIAEYLKTPLTKAEVSSFPDGETFVRILENIRGEDVFIIQPTCNPSNHNIMELLIICDAVRRASANSITAVIPFFGYARQDRKDQPRVPITSKLIVDLMHTAGFNRAIILDLHAGQIQGFFNYPVDHLYAAPTLLEYIRTLKLDPLVVVSPDVGGVKMTQAYARALDADLAIVAKRRLNASEVEATNLIGDVKDSHVLLVDDMTETAGTLVAAANMLEAEGALSIRAAVSHAQLSTMGFKRLNASKIEELICSDSVPLLGREDYAGREKSEKVKVVSIAPLLARAIYRVQNKESVSSLFDI